MSIHGKDKVFPFILSIIGSVVLFWLVGCGEKLAPNGTGENNAPDADILSPQPAPSTPLEEALLIVSSTEGGSSTLTVANPDPGSLALIGNISLGNGAVSGTVSENFYIVTQPKLDNAGLPKNGKEIQVYDLATPFPFTLITDPPVQVGEQQGGVLGAARDSSLGLTFISIYHEGAIAILDETFTWRVSKSAGVNPSGIAVDEEHDRIFVVNTNAEGQGCGGTIASTISVFQCSAEAEEPATSCKESGEPQETGGRNAFAIAYDASRGSVIVANYSDDNIAIWNVDVPISEEQPLEKIDLEKGAGPIALILDSEGDRLFVVNQGNDSITSLQLGESTLEIEGTISFPAGTAPTSAAIRTTDSTKTLYVTDNLENSITVCDITHFPSSADCNQKIFLGEGLQPTSVQYYRGGNL
ncbi:MAG: beta-propeller fold lactonase family protein [Deltaproteobacteria bacterium]|nr:beta-propeller fold lactonase family protein [Deltaproteobacteria bacterium]